MDPNRPLTRLERNGQRGFALVTVMLLLALIMAVGLSYWGLTSVELNTTKSSMDSFRGFYAAEAGLNARAESVRATFVGYNLPAGSSPATGGSNVPCVGGNNGSGDFSCANYLFQDRDVSTYVVETAGNPSTIVIPDGDPFENLNALEYRYVVSSVANGPQDTPEAILELHFKSRLVPMFQFAAFYNKDLEILPGQPMTLAGPVHSNGDLYVEAGVTLDVIGQTSTFSELFHGRKNANSCTAGPVSVIDPAVLQPIPACTGGTRREITPADVTAWNEMIKIGTEDINVPPPEALDPVVGEVYWDKADLRVMLDMNSGGTIRVYNPNGMEDAARTTLLGGCTGAASYNTQFYNNREATAINMLDVNMLPLLNCIENTGLLDGTKQLDDGTEGGLVFYLGVEGPNMTAVNNYGVRVRGGASLDSTVGGAATVQGLTVVTNQAIYVQGDYNSAPLNKKPAAFLADSLNILSNNWNDANDTLHVTSRVASTTTINAAFLAGTDTTGAEGAFGGSYNGGLENYPRMHENWTGRALNYTGSFVSLNVPVHVAGGWVYGHPQYTAPVRNFAYDTDFNNPANLPPLTPRFVYLRQELFVRQFEM